MTKKDVTVALDIGSTNIKVLIARLQDNNISVIGTHSMYGSGIKDGIINNIDQAVESIVEVLNKGEMMSGYPISKVIVITSGTHIASLNSSGVVAVSAEDNEIAESDVVRVKQAAEAVSLGANRQIIHAIPKEFIVDTQRNIKNPIGMTGLRLEVEANIIHGSSTILKNITKSISQVGLSIEQVIYAGYASAEAVLTETEKNLGCVCLDIGGGTIDFIVYQKGTPSFCTVIPVGGQSVTNQIAIGLRTTIEKAEEVKLKYNREYVDTDHAEIADKKLDTRELDIESDEVSSNIIKGVTEKKLIEAFKYVQVYLKKSGYDKKVPAGVIITGGTANTIHVKDIAETILRLPARIGTATNLVGLIDQINGPESSALIGAIKLANKENQSQKKNNSTLNENKTTNRISNTSTGIIDFLKSFLP